MPGDLRAELEREEGEREPWAQVRPDPPYLAVGGEFEDHCVSELQRPDCTVTHHHAHRVLTNLFAPIQLRQAAVDSTEQNAKVIPATEHHAARDWRDQLGIRGKPAALGMAFKLLKTAEERWRRFNGHELVADVLAGARFTDGIRVPDEHPNQEDEKVAA